MHNEAPRGTHKVLEYIFKDLAMISILQRVLSPSPSAGRLQHADLESQKNPQNFPRAVQEEGKSLALQSSESEPGGSGEGISQPAESWALKCQICMGALWLGERERGGRASELRNGRKYEEEGDKLENSAKTSWHSRCR